MGSILDSLIRLLRIADTVRSVVKTLDLLKKLVRGLKGRPLGY